MREASFYFALSLSSSETWCLRIWYWPKVNNCLLRCCAELGLNSTRQKISIYYCCVQRHVWMCIVAATQRHTLDGSHCDCLFVVVGAFFSFDFHGFLDWSRSTKTGAHSRFVMAAENTKHLHCLPFGYAVTIRCQHLTRYRVIDDHRLCVCASAFFASKIIRLSLGCSLPKC